MKKFLCMILSTIIFTINVIFIPYTTPVYASDIVGEVVKSIAFDNVVKMVRSLYTVGYNAVIGKDGDGATSTSSTSLDAIWGEDSAINNWLQTKLFPFMDANQNIDLTKEDCPITYDNEKQLVEFNPTFTNELTEKVQDSVHALDGYYLFDSDYSLSDFTSLFYWYKNFSDNDKKIFTDFFNSHETVFTFNNVASRSTSLWLNGIDSTDYLYIKGSNVYRSTTSETFSDGLSVSVNQFAYIYSVTRGDISISSPSAFVNKKVYTFGAPFKVFYSENDLNKYLDNGKKRTYAPKLPSGGLKIPLSYIKGTANLPDLNINLDSLIGKAEADIQADIDLALKNYFDKLLELNNNPSQPTNPTPTPSHGGSGGDFGDGTTPTPTPSIGDGGDDSGNGKVDLSEITDLLKKILSKLTSFADSHTKFEKTITDYIETNDGKLDQIIDAIDKLSQGKEDGEDYKCKYDYTELSDYLKKLWNDSDKKFDTMIDLLEENNEYQQKLVDTLDSIKSILIKESIMDSFKDRSKETANKAKEKFPTSVPWDIAIVINAMSATPEKPKFNLPIKIASLNIDENIEVDLSSGEWEKLAKTCRYMLSLLFVLFMVQLSRRLFFNKGDDD